MKDPGKEGEEGVSDPQEKGEQEEGRERSRRAAAVKATQTLQANEAVSLLHPKGRAGRPSEAWGVDGRTARPWRPSWLETRNFRLLT